MSIFHVDPNNPIITLPDGTQAHVQGVVSTVLINYKFCSYCSITIIFILNFFTQINSAQGANGHTVHSVHTISEGQNQDGVTVDILNNVPEATMNQEGQIIITGEDGQGKS